MKQNVLFLLIFISYLFVHSYAFNLDSILNNMNMNQNELETDSDNMMDTDDLIFKMKSFFEQYANKLKNNIKVATKVILPSDNEKDNPEYITNFDIEELKRRTQGVLDDINKIREKDLRNYRDEKQQVEEKNIDLMTRNKILNSRMNIADSEKNKLLSDFNDKNNNKNTIIHEIKSHSEKSEKLLDSSVERIKNTDQFMKKFDTAIHGLNLYENIFEDQLNLENKLTDLKLKNYLADFEDKFYKDSNSTNLNFIQAGKGIESIFEEGLKKIRSQNILVENSIKNKTEVIKKIKNKIEGKYEKFNKLNITNSNLKSIQQKFVSI